MLLRPLSALAFGLFVVVTAACPGRPITTVDKHPTVPHPGGEGEGEGAHGGEGEGAHGGEGEGSHTGEGEGEGSGDQGCTVTIEILQPICAAH